MPNSVQRTLSAIALVALASVPLSAGVTLISADAAYANNGKGQGQAKGQSKSQGTSSNRGQERKAEREAIMQEAGAQNWGAIASELAEFNKANANINARMNSSDPVHQALGEYQLSGGITTSGITAYNDAKKDYETYKEGLIGEEVVDPDTGVAVTITEENVDQYAESFEDYSGLSEELVDAYEALADLDDLRDEPLTSGAVAALNSMLGLEDPISE